MSLELRSVCKSYDQHVVFKNLDLTFEPATISLIRGPSGSGKTTLLRVSSLLDPVNSGRIFLEGREFAHVDLYRSSAWSINQPFRSRVSIVFQQLFMWPHLRMADALQVTWRSSPTDLTRVELMQFLGLAGLEDRFPRELSLGQLQRFAFLRSIGTGASYFFMDEVTSALDKSSKSKTLEVIKEMVKCGKGVIFVTHDPTVFGDSYDQLIEFGQLGDPISVEGNRPI
ncbi:MAG: ATP-binding cassette domain-containing protein [Pseudomonadota bacterium]